MSNNGLPVSVQTMIIQQDGMSVYYPQVVGLRNKNIEERINQEILAHVQTLMSQQYKEQGTDAFVEMIGSYEIKTNERNILSLSLTNYAFAYQHAHGLTLMKSLTFDVQTGESYSLANLFKPGSNYEKVLSRMIKKQIEARKIPLLGEFTTISSDQDFYIADKVLIVYFQLYEITPHYVGFPMFPISVYILEEIIKQNGALGRMAAN